MPISMKTGLLALMRWVSTNTPTALDTPGVLRRVDSCLSSIVLANVSDTPF